MKMQQYFNSILILLLFSAGLNAQSIWFVNPTHGMEISNSYSETQVMFNFQFNYRRSSDPNLISSYVKLIAGNNHYRSDQGSGIPQWFYLAPGTYNWRLELYESNGITGSFKTAEQTITFFLKHDFIVRNNFTYGIINVDGSQRNSPYHTKKFTANSVNAGAIDQVYQNINRVWNNSGTNNSTWKVQKMSGTTSGNLSTARNYTYTLASNDNGSNLIAYLRNICATTFKNQHSGGEVGGNIIVNGTNYTSPTPSTNVVELNKITGTASNHEINGIWFNFQKWSNNSTSYQTDFYPNVHTEYQAIFNGRPTNTYRNQRFNAKVVGQPIVVYWDQHPNTNVTKYAIYRKVGKTGTEQYLTTINRTSASTYSYTDGLYVHTNSTSSENLLFYDVRAYYAPDNNYSNPNFEAIYGQPGDPKKEGEILSEAMISYEYGISNYPNPFNPTSTINYTIKEIGNVNITIYDALGRKVKELLNEIKTPGSYEVKFDGSNLSSGIYIYTMQVNNFFESKKMILTK